MSAMSVVSCSCCTVSRDSGVASCGFSYAGELLWESAASGTIPPPALALGANGSLFALAGSGLYAVANGDCSAPPTPSPSPASQPWPQPGGGFLLQFRSSFPGPLALLLAKSLDVGAGTLQSVAATTTHIVLSSSDGHP